MYFKTFYRSPVGELALACDEKNLVGLWMAGQKYYGDTVPGEMLLRDDIPLLEDTKKWLDRYFTGECPELSELPLSPIGGEFRQGVWRILCEIPYGKTLTYGEIAAKMAAKDNNKRISAQAVGGAVGHNPISIIVPCHRVVGTNGSLTGYSGGIDKKIKLLELEGVDVSRFFAPKK